MLRQPTDLLGGSLIALAGVLAGCSSTASAPDDQVSVVVTTTMLGSVTADIVACADPAASVTTLLPVGADPHDFAPSSEQVADLVTADLVVANGLGLEAGMQEALDNATTDGARILAVAELVDPLPFGGPDVHAGEDAHADEGDDPHFWFDLSRMAVAVEAIGDTLAETQGEAYADCGRQVADAIRTADEQVRATLESVPAERRVLVTDHDALGYLADAYGYEIVGTVIPGGSTLGEPSSADLAALLQVIEAEDVPAIFTNSASSQDLAESVASESDREVAVVELYVESLGEPGSGAETYLGAMQANADRISSALGE